jgi:hypothetical protein
MWWSTWSPWRKKNTKGGFDGAQIRLDGLYDQRILVYSGFFSSGGGAAGGFSFSEANFDFISLMK